MARLRAATNVLWENYHRYRVDTPEVGQTAISFDGDPVDISVDDRLYNTGWKSGFSGAIAASSGGIETY